MPRSVSFTDTDVKMANFKFYLLRDGLRFQSKSKRKLSSDAWKGEESPRLRNLNALSLTTDKMAKKVKKGHFKNFAAQPMLRETRPFLFLFSSLAEALIVALKPSLGPKHVSEGGPTGPRSELVRIHIHNNIVQCDLTANLLSTHNFKCYLL